MVRKDNSRCKSLGVCGLHRGGRGHWTVASEARWQGVGCTGGQGQRPGGRAVGEEMESGTSRFPPWTSGGQCRDLLRAYCAPHPAASP